MELVGTSASSGVVSNVDATREVGEPIGWPFGSTDNKTIWFHWTAPEDGVASFANCGAPFATQISLVPSRWLRLARRIPRGTRRSGVREWVV